jgi:hypothetical protein
VHDRVGQCMEIELCDVGTQKACVA